MSKTRMHCVIEDLERKAFDETLPVEERLKWALAALTVSGRELTEREYRRGAEIAAELGLRQS